MSILILLSTQIIMIVTVLRDFARRAVQDGKTFSSSIAIVQIDLKVNGTLASYLKSNNKSSVW